MNLLESDKITFDAKHRRFVVVPPRGPLFVKLFPKPECQCGSDGNCYHVLACKILLGMRETKNKTRRKFNSRALAKNQRLKTDMTSGRKKPRKRDLDVAHDQEQLGDSTESNDEIVVPVVYFNYIYILNKQLYPLIRRCLRNKVPRQRFNR